MIVNTYIFKSFYIYTYVFAELCDIEFRSEK